MAEDKKKKADDSNNIKVCVRVRPFLPREFGGEGPHRLIISMPTRTKVVIEDEDGYKKDYDFDRAYWSHAKIPGKEFTDQDFLYSEMGQDLIENAVAGYNNCLFAYGQTGSGKTWSVLGDYSNPTNWGLLPRVVRGLFDRMKEEKELKASEGLKFEVDTCVAFLELYNEQINDLLVPRDQASKKPLEIRNNDVVGIHVPGLTDAPVSTYEEVMDLLDAGIKMRTVAATAMNDNSSRSHSIFTFKLSFTIQEQAGGPEITKRSQVHLVDLAGSERQKKTKAEGDTLKQGIMINKSLTTLAKVIATLSDQAAGKGKGQVPPFRESKLTHLLKDALSGNSKTVMMTAISPALSSHEETTSTLQFAQSVKKITTKAVANSVSNADMASQLRIELEKLKKELAECESGGVGGAGGGCGSSPSSTGKKAKVTNIKKNMTPEQIEALKARIREDSQLCSNLEKTPEERQQEGDQVKSRIQSDLNERGIMTKSQVSYRRATVNQLSPYVVNISDDPLVSGSLMYILPEGATTTIGSDPKCKIVLDGPGMWPYMCSVQVTAQGDQIKLMMEVPTEFAQANGLKEKQKPGAKRKVHLNRKVVQDSKEELEINHDDEMMFGRSHSFRLVDPRKALQALAVVNKNDDDSDVDSDDSEKWDPEEKARTMLTEIVDEVYEDSQESCDGLRSLLEEVAQHVGAIRTRAFLSRIKRALLLTQEAMDLASEVSFWQRLRFRVTVISNPATYKHEVPKLCINLIRRKRGKELWRCIVRQKVLKEPTGIMALMKSILNTNRQADLTEVSLSLFTIEDFRQRLISMREVASDFALNPEVVFAQMREQPFNDPWFILDAEEMVGALQDLAHTEKEAAEQMRAHKKQLRHMSRTRDDLSREVEEGEYVKRSLNEAKASLKVREKQFQELKKEREEIAKRLEMTVESEDSGGMRQTFEELKKQLETERKATFKLQDQVRALRRGKGQVNHAGGKPAVDGEKGTLKPTPSKGKGIVLKTVPHIEDFGPGFAEVSGDIRQLVATFGKFQSNLKGLYKMTHAPIDIDSAAIKYVLDKDSKKT